MYNCFTDKVIVVTGASKGIGKHLTHLLVTSGARVAGIARSKDILEETALEFEGLAGEFLRVICDVSDRKLVSAAMRQVTQKLGPIDILINNAGIGLTGPIMETEKRDATKCFDVNFYGAVNCIEYTLPEMIQRRNGIIVNVTSVVAKYGLPTTGYYSAAKAALSAYSQALRAEVAPAGVKVITIYPGNTDTEFHSSQLTTKNYISRKTQSKQLDPEDVAKKILSAIQKNKAEVIIGRPAKIMILLKAFLPQLVEFLVKKELGVAQWYRKTVSQEIRMDSVDRCIQEGIPLKNMDRSCRYHQSTELVHWWNVVPEGLKPSLQYILYPYLLATTYGGKLPEDQTYQHPLLTNEKLTDIKEKSPALLEQIKNFIKTCLLPVMPMGRAKSAPEIKIGKNIYPFDLGQGGTLCPASFRSFFPFLARKRLKDEKENISSSWEVCCPDHLKNLTFGSGKGDTDFYDSICFWGKSAEIKALSPCKSQINTASHSLDDIAKQLEIPCPTLLNVAYGYYLTLERGGELGFYSKSLDAGIFQCPNPRSRVVVEISKNNAAINFKVINVIGDACPRGIHKDDEFDLPKKSGENKFCMDAFNSLYLYAGLSEFLKTPLTVQCALNNCPSSWQVHHHNTVA